MTRWKRAQIFKDLWLRVYNWKADVLMQKLKKMIWYAREAKHYFSNAKKIRHGLMDRDTEEIFLYFFF